MEEGEKIVKSLNEVVQGCAELKESESVSFEVPVIPGYKIDLRALVKKIINKKKELGSGGVVTLSRIDNTVTATCWAKTKEAVPV